MRDNVERVCVHGLGYVGLPTAAMLANTGYYVDGFDVDPERRKVLRGGNVDTQEEDLSRFVTRALEDGLEIVDSVKESDVHLICVPTPYDNDLDRTDLSFVEAAGETIAEKVRSDDIVVLESTVPPGTTAKLLRDMLERSGLSAREDFLLGYSPETVLPGNTLAELRRNDRLIGTVCGRPADRIVELFDTFTLGDLRTTDATTAEFVKLIQNAYRDVNIAYANEVAKLANEFGIDSRNAIALANNHPRVDILRPGPGVGGHCLPIDPLFLNHGNDIPMLIETARAVNDGMVDFIVELLSAALGDLDGTTVTLLGVAYKGGIADIRKSPSLALAERLTDAGVKEVRLSDPYVEENRIGREVLALDESLTGADGAILVTDHPEYGALAPTEFAERMRSFVIIDTRAMLDQERWEAEGFDMYQI